MTGLGRFLREPGFTLLEVVIVMAVVALLAMFAYPSYLDQLKKSRRVDAMDALVHVQYLQERWRAGNASYSSSLEDIGYPAAVSSHAYYDIAIREDPIPSSVAFKVTATARVGTSQAGDSSCVEMSISVDALAPRGLKEPKDCWRR